MLNKKLQHQDTPAARLKTSLLELPAKYIRNIILAKAGEGGLANYDEIANEMLDAIAAVEGAEGSQDSMGLGGIDLDLLENPIPNARAGGNTAAAVASASSSAPAPAPASGGGSEEGGVQSGMREIGRGSHLAHPGGGAGGEEEEGGQAGVRGEEGVVEDGEAIMTEKVDGGGASDEDEHAHQGQRSESPCLVCRASQCAAVCCSVLHCVAVCCIVLYCVAVCCSVLQCVAVCCSVLQCVAVCCIVLQCVAVCCSVL